MKKLLIAIIVASVLIVGTIVGVSVYASSPKVIVRNSIGNAFDDLLDRDEVEPIVKMLQKGSLEINASSEIEDMKGELGGKIYFNNEAVYFENFFVESDNIEISADAYFGPDSMYVTNEEILDGTYGIVRGNLAESFKNSIFALGSGSRYEILDAEMYNTMVDMFTDIDNEVDRDLQKDYEKLVKKYAKFLVKTLEKHAEYDKEKDDVKLGGEFRRARVITVSIDEKALANIIKDIYEKIEDDDDLKEFVVKYGDYLLAYYNRFGESTEEIDIEEKYEDLLDEFEKFIEEELDKDSIEDTLGDFKVEFDVVTATGSSKLLQISCTLKSEGAKQELFTLDFGKKGIAKTDLISLDLVDGGVIIEYEVTENTSKEYIGKMTVSSKEGAMYSSDSSEFEVFRLSIDKKEDEFKLSIPLEDGEHDDIVVRGSLVVKSKKTTITVNKITAGEETFDDFEIKVVIDEKDSMPKPVKKDKITNVFSMSEKDIENIIGKAEEDLGGLEGNPFPDDSEDESGIYW